MSNLETCRARAGTFTVAPKLTAVKAEDHRDGYKRAHQSLQALAAVAKLELQP